MLDTHFADTWVSNKSMGVQEIQVLDDSNSLCEYLTSWHVAIDPEQVAKFRSLGVQNRPEIVGVQD